MSEHQHIEWKVAWRDECLKWICGFANAEGGALVIGKDDKGKVVGLSNAKKLLEEIPNKVRDLLGIMVDVNLHHENGEDLIEIVVEPYPYPISYKGQYHYRSGSTKQELKGAALDKFLLRKLGRHWDGVPVSQVVVKDLSSAVIDTFRELARQSRRLDATILRESAPGLIEKLHLLVGSYLKRAALLLFHPDPERFVTGAYVKIGFFRTNADLLYHDEIHGDLFSQVEKTIELLITKYLKAGISYQGIQRMETLPVPEAALREGVLEPDGLWVEVPFPRQPAGLDSGERWGEKWGEKWSASALAKRRKIAETIMQDSRVTITQLATNLRMGTTAIEKHLKAMREQGCIRRVGPARGGHWEVLP